MWKCWPTVSVLCIVQYADVFMIDLRTECHMITCNDSLIIPQKPEVEEVLPLGRNFTSYSCFSRTKLAHFTLYSAEQNLHILRCTKVLPNKSLMFFQTLLPYIISRICSVASVSPTSYVRAHIVSLIAGYFFYHGTTTPSGPRPHYRGFTIILRHTTVGWTPLDKW